MRVRKKVGDTDVVNASEPKRDDEEQERRSVSQEDKKREITRWLQRTREKHVREISLYERFTVSTDREAGVLSAYSKLFSTITSRIVDDRTVPVACGA